MGDLLPEGLLAIMAGLLTFQKLGLIVLGVSVGLIGGALPGISASVAIALVLPLTFSLDPTSALILLGAIYMAAEYGGSVSAVLINTPGTPAAICTALDGHPMAVEGRAREALYVAIIASSIGGLFGVAILLLFTPPLAAFSLAFGAPEMFWLAVAGLAIVCNLAADNFLKGVIAASIGLWIATIGQDPLPQAFTDTRMEAINWKVGLNSFRRYWDFSLLRKCCLYWALAREPSRKSSHKQVHCAKPSRCLSSNLSWSSDQV